MDHRPFFPAGYDACRAAFRDLAAGRGARLEFHPMQARGPAGEALTIDTAWIGAERPRRLFLVTAGTHGVEGPAGTAAQLQFLAEDLDLLRLPADGAVLLVHGVNPWGMAWDRRYNEDNVDLNRNFLDFSRPPPDRPDYARVAHLLAPDSIDAAAEAAFMAQAQALIAEKGLAWVQARFTEGQYDHPDGLYYGGRGPTESNRILRPLLRRAMDGVEEVLHIDMHTGMGAFGDWIMILAAEAGSASHHWLAHAFPPQRVEAVYGGDSRWPAVSGKFGRAVMEEAPHARVHSFSCEFGTHPPERVFQAERHEHWLHRHGDRSSDQGRAIVAEHKECFVPESPVWRRLCLAGSRACFADGWRALFHY